MKFKIKFIVFMFVFVGFFTNLTGQIAYYDALELSKIGEISNGKIKLKINAEDLEKFRILAVYDKSLNSDSVPEDVKAAYDNAKNPFISIEIETDPEYILTSIGELPETSVSSIAGISAVTVFDGIAKFLVGRVKEELSAAFFQKFKDEIKKDKYKIYKHLFPETFKMLETIDEEIYKFSSYIQVLREAFEKDLSNVYENLPEVFKRLMEVEEIKNFFGGKQWLKVILESGFYVIDGLKKEKHPGNILADFDTEILVGDELKNLKNAIKLLQIISDSLREKNGGNMYWISTDSLKKLFEMDNNQVYVVFKLYLGLIYQKSKSEQIQFKVEIKNQEITIIFADELAKLKMPLNQVEDVENKIEDFVYRVNLLEYSLKDLKQIRQNSKKPTYNDYYKFYDAALDTFEYSLEFFNYVMEKANPNEETVNKKIIEESKVKKYLDVARSMGDIYMDVNNRNYGSVVYNVIKIFDMVVPEVLRKKDKFAKIRADLLKYGSFLAAVANAQNSDEVKEAIKAVVLPAGSSSIKRNSSCNISLNAYVGGAFVFKGKDDESDVNKARVWAPIGLAFSKGKIEFLFIRSFTLFASIIDIGAVTAFRFKDESAEEIPKFTLKNLVSPGLHAVLGIKNSPISFGVGYQRLPQLRKINLGGDNKIITDNTWKWNVFIGVDIPLLNFKTK